MTQPLISCCTCQYARADLQRKYNLKKNVQLSEMVAICGRKRRPRND